MPRGCKRGEKGMLGRAERRTGIDETGVYHVEAAVMVVH
jgi:hypothetical protein